MGLGEVFSRAFEDYKTNFKEVFKIILVFYGLPQLILLVFLVMNVDIVRQLELAMVSAFSSNQVNWQILSNTFVSFLPYLCIQIVLSFVVFLISLIGYTAIIGQSLQKKFNFPDANRLGFNYYWRLLGVIIMTSLPWIVLGVLSLPLVYLAYQAVVAMAFGGFDILQFGSLILYFIILLILGAIAFFIYLYLYIKWVFAPFALFKEQKVKKSLKESASLVRGNWWKTFGIVLLLILTIGVASWVIGVVFKLLEQIVVLAINGMPNGNNVLYGLNSATIVVSQIISTISKFVVTLLTLPFSIFFLKNFFLERQKKSI